MVHQATTLVEVLTILEIVDCIARFEVFLESPEEISHDVSNSNLIPRWRPLDEQYHFDRIVTVGRRSSVKSES